MFKNGIAGVHYANGWTGLANMVERYGEDYAPTMIAAPPEEYPSPPARRRTVSPPDQDHVSLMEDDEETVAFGRPDSLNEEHEGEQGDEQINDADAVADDINNNNGPPVTLVRAIEQINEAANNDPSPANVQDDNVEEEQANALLPRVESPTTLASILDCLQKCTDVLSRLEDNPNFHAHLQSAACKDQMWRTIETLNAELAICNNNEWL